MILHGPTLDTPTRNSRTLERTTRPPFLGPTSKPEMGHFPTQIEHPGLPHCRHEHRPLASSIWLSCVKQQGTCQQAVGIGAGFLDQVDQRGSQFFMIALKPVPARQNQDLVTSRP